MKTRCFLTWTLILLAIPAFSQIRFEKGYFINNQDQKVACLLRNAGWENNPQSFRYKLTPESEVLTASVSDVKEFGTDDGTTYIRQEARIDESPTDVGALSHDRNPVWASRTVFLNRLLDGPARLFLYRSGNLRQFYYQKGDSLIVPLIFKRYVNDDGQEMTNYGFRQQLLNDVACASVSKAYMAKLAYKAEDMISYFEKYNTCIAPGAQHARRPEKRDALHLRFTPGLSMNLLALERFTFTKDGARSVVKPSLRIGLEGEYLLAVNRNKWSVLIEPVWQHFQYDLNVVNTEVNIRFWSADVAAGVRHYFFLKNGSRLFINALGVIRAKTGTFGNQDQEMDIYTNWFHYAAGAGFAKKRLSAEVRYNSPVPFRSSYIRIDAQHAKLSFVLGYRLF